VPGISSIVAGPNYAGIPLTHREHCSSFTVITGHEDPTKEETALDYEQLAKSPGTKVILMGVERIRQIADSLVAQGMDKGTPVGMVRWGTTGQQESIAGTLGNIADIVAEKKFAAPAVTIIGDVVKLRQKLNWFEHRPLFGQRIVVTRTREQASELSRQLSEMGAEVLEIPTIRIVPPDEKQPLLEMMKGLGEYDWIVFTSPNGVIAFFDYFFKAFDDVRALGNLRIAAVGPATAAKLKELHLRVDVMPEEYLTKKVTRAIGDFESIENLRFLLARAQVANRELAKELEDRGAIVDDIAVYKTVPETEDITGAAAKLLEGGADWITFTSSSTVENFHARFDLPKLITRFPRIKLASIGPETSKAIAARIEALGRGQAARHSGTGQRVARSGPEAGWIRRTTFLNLSLRPCASQVADEELDNLFVEKPIGGLAAEAVHLTGLDLELIRSVGLRQRLQEIHRVLQVHVVVRRAVDQENPGFQPGRGSER
jgi:uroporphyrinogen III methyltransferase/synthase